MSQIILSTNRLASSPHYKSILRKYNELFAQKGKVNGSKFYNEFIKSVIPGYSLNAWLRFIARFKNTAEGITTLMTTIKEPSAGIVAQENQFQQNAITMSQAQNFALRKTLDIGLARLNELGENPSQISFSQAIELIFKVMRAQDSRARVIKEIRQDVREQEKFEKLLNDEAYGPSE